MERNARMRRRTKRIKPDELVRPSGRPRMVHQVHVTAPPHRAAIVMGALQRHVDDMRALITEKLATVEAHRKAQLMPMRATGAPTCALDPSTFAIESYLRECEEYARALCSSLEAIADDERRNGGGGS